MCFLLPVSAELFRLCLLPAPTCLFLLPTAAACSNCLLLLPELTALRLVPTVRACCPILFYLTQSSMQKYYMLIETLSRLHAKERHSLNLLSDVCCQ